jgi:alpha-D-glucose phosphate-specific phosphoglucomutase
MGVIKFGTSGWRAILAEDFTFDHVAVACQAIAEHLKAGGQAGKGVLVAYDPRFLGDEFARLACEVLAGNGISSFLCNRDTPTPVVAYEELRRRLGGAINFTASHNPAEYNGLKFNPAWGGPATYEVTKDIEARADKTLRRGPSAVRKQAFSDAASAGLVREIDPMPSYFKRLKSLVDTAAIRRGKLRVVVDALHGAGRGYTEKALSDAGAACEVLHAERDVLFGGLNPDPSEENLGALVAEVKKRRASLGVATDGDADRFGIVDFDGTFLVPNLVIALLIHHLKRTRKWGGPVVRSVASSHFIDAVAAKYGVEVVETPVGFKWIGQLMTQRDILIGGEESGGLTVHGHVPEKDGVLACLLMAEMRAVEGRPFKAVLKELYAELGEFFVGRGKFELPEKAKQALGVRLTKKTPATVAGRKVVRHVTLDGHKLLLEGGAWLMVRFSGTEPVVRLYLEARSQAELEALKKAGRDLILG